MSTFVFKKADPWDLRDIGFEIEDANARLAALFPCTVNITNYSSDSEQQPWVAVELLAKPDCAEAERWYLAELSDRGLVLDIRSSRPQFTSAARRPRFFRRENSRESDKRG